MQNKEGTVRPRYQPPPVQAVIEMDEPKLTANNVQVEVEVEPIVVEPVEVEPAEVIIAEVVNDMEEELESSDAKNRAQNRQIVVAETDSEDESAQVEILN